jgi:molecular chaperone DnaK
VVQGEREQASLNKSLGRFELAGIPSAPRGMPQIEVTFDIDANGILNVSAKDKGTGKAQSIIIKASSGLNEDEIKNMVKDAESHKEEDRKFKELVDVRNRADNMIHTTTKSMKEMGAELPEGDKQAIESAIEALQQAMKGSDKDAMEARLEELTKASHKMAEKLYAKQAEASQGFEKPKEEAKKEGGKGEDVVDAEFEEVKDDKGS